MDLIILCRTFFFFFSFSKSEEKGFGLVGIIVAVNIVKLVRNRINFIMIQIGFLSVFLSWNDVQSYLKDIPRIIFH